MISIQSNKTKHSKCLNNEKINSLYKTVVERDWAYIAKREYNYDVKYSSWGWGFFWGNVATSVLMFAQKKFVIWPLPVVGTIAALYYILTT